MDAPLREGGMGEVWSGRHTESGLPVAIKVLMSDRTRDAEFIAAFRREVRAVAALDHPGIIKVYEYGTLDAAAAQQAPEKLVVGSPYLVMELAESCLVDKVPVSDWEDLKALTLTLLGALAHAHAHGLIHRDIKPANILQLPPTGEPCPVTGGMAGIVLTDFGIAHAVVDEAVTGPIEASCGTPGYMAPEQFEGAWRAFGPWTDLYALGCVIWRFACGQRPFVSRDVMMLMRHHMYEPLPQFTPRFPVPDDLESWLQRAMAKEPSDRFQRAADAALALRCLSPVSAGGAMVPPNAILDDENLPTIVQTPQLPDTIVPNLEEPTLPVAHRAPPVPATWGQEACHHPALLLQGAGLGLYGLRTIPLVGRADERDVLWSTLKEAQSAGQPRVVALHGPAGCGKSRLAKWLTTRAHEVGAAHVLHGVHSPIAGPGDGLGPMLARFLRCTNLSRENVIVRLKRLLTSRGISDSREWRALAAVVAPSGLRFRNPVERFVLIERHLQRMCAERPVIVWLDDVQWGLDALTFVAHVMGPANSDSRATRRRRGPMPAVFVMTARDDAVAEEQPAAELLAKVLELPGARGLQVGPLSTAEQPQLVRGLLGLEGELATRVERRTAGNPLFAVELVGDWVRRGLLEPGEDGFRLRPGARAELPDDLHTLWSSRVERVLAGRPEPDRVAVELAAVLGAEVDAAEWDQVCRQSGIETPTELVEALLAEHLATTGPEGPKGSWSFGHNMLRESLIRCAAEAYRLEPLHGVCADMLAGKSGQGVAERLGRHLVSASKPAAALDPLAQGISERFDAGDSRTAEVLMGEREGALKDAALSDDDPRQADGPLARVRLLRMRGNFEQAEAGAEAVLAAAKKHGWDDRRAIATQELGRLMWVQGRPELAAHKLADAVQLSLSDPGRLADCKRVMGLVLMTRGLLEKASGYFEQALAAYEAVDDEVWAAACQMNLGVAVRQAGRLDEARVRVRVALARFTAADCGWGEAECLNELGEVARFDGDLAAAEACYRQALARNVSLGSGDAVFNEINLGLVLSLRGNTAEARAALEAGLETFDSQGRRAFVGVTHALLLPCEAADGDWRRWDYHLTNAQIILDVTGFVDMDVAAALERAGDLAAAAGETKRAVGAYDLAAGQWRGLDREDGQARVAAAIDVIQSIG